MKNKRQCIETVKQQQFGVDIFITVTLIQSKDILYTYLESIFIHITFRPTY